MKTYIIKLGGSMVSKSEDLLIDFEFLKEFKSIITEFSAQGDRFFIAVGGGFLMRKMRDLAKAGGIEEDTQLHWIGTTVNVLNAQIVRAYMHEICNGKVFGFEDYYDDKKVVFEKNVILGGGGRPGHSGDVDALVMAQRLDIENIISLKNVDAVYTADPKLYDDVTPIDKLTWDEYFKVIGFQTEHPPGGNFPVDPIASRDAKASKKTFTIIAGSDLPNLKKVLKGEPFKGSLIY